MAPDIVHIHSLGPAGLAAVGAAKRFGVAYGFTWHTDLEEYVDRIPLGRAAAALLLIASLPSRPLPVRTVVGVLTGLRQPRNAVREALTGLMAGAAFCTASSPKGVDQARRYGAVRPRLIPHVLPEVERGPSSAHRLVCVSRLSREKNVDAVVSLMPDLVTSADVHLDVFGDGPERRKLVREARRLGVVDRIHFRGCIPNHVLRRSLSQYSLMLHPGLADISPMVLVEACSAALPVVGIDDELPKQLPRGGMLTAASGAGFDAQTTGRLLGDESRRRSLSNAMSDSAAVWPTGREIAEMLVETYESALEPESAA
jgi:1,2-diacylglycerol 3-alpha-glucosyltransferase